MITVSNLSKSFGDFQAVDNISFDVKPGEVLGFLGPNGAGKSTTMKMLTGFLTPSAGSVSVMGFDIEKNALDAQRQIGYLPEGAPSYADMTVSASLNFIGKARGYKGEDLKARIAKVVGLVQLESVLDRRIENLSKGFRRRLGLAQALIHDPQVLVLDEPTDGLDPNQKHQVRELIRNLAADKIVIVSTHILEEVSAVCSRAMILAQGRILFDGTPDELAARSEFHNAVNVRVTKLEAGLVSALQSLASVERVIEQGDDELMVFPQDGGNILAEVNQVLQAQGCQVEELHVEVGRLDDVFRTLTTASVGQKSVTAQPATTQSDITAEVNA